MTEIEHQGTVAMEVTPAPQNSQAEFFRLIAKHYMNALERIVTEATNLETCHRLACEALGSPPHTRIEPQTDDLVGRLRRYRPRDEFGDPVKHTICNEAADEIERLRTPAPQDLSRGYPQELTEDLRAILSLMMWNTGPMAHALRDGGQDIKRKAEDEQAEVMHWLIGLALEHGSEWRAKASDRIREIQASVKAAASEGRE